MLSQNDLTGECIYHFQPSDSFKDIWFHSIGQVPPYIPAPEHQSYSSLPSSFWQLGIVSNATLPLLSLTGIATSQNGRFLSYTLLKCTFIPEMWSTVFECKLCCCSLVAKLCLTLLPSQAPLPMGFPRKEYWTGLPFPSPRSLINPGIKPVSPALAVGLFTTEPPGKLPQQLFLKIKICHIFF